MSVWRIALTPRYLECCFIWNGSVGGSQVVSVPQQHLQILAPAMEWSLREGEIPAMDFGSLSLLRRGYPIYRAMLLGL